VGSLAPARLAFVDGPLKSARPQKDSPAPPPPVEPPRGPIVAAAGQIDDAEIRTRFLESASRYLSRSRA
jgi:hypothetical protein